LILDIKSSKSSIVIAITLLDPKSSFRILILDSKYGPSHIAI